MNFERAFRLSSYGLLLTGFLSLVSANAVGLPFSVLYVVAVLGSWRVRSYHLAGWLQFVLFILFVGIFALDASLFSDSVSATVHILILTSLAKLYTRKEERDYLILYFVSFGFLLFASAYTISIAFLATLVLYIFSAILTFILFESKKAYEENRSASFSLRGYVNVALVITALMVLISIPIFLVIPRAAMGLLRVDRRLELNMSGFSDTVNLGDMGEIILNSNIVMRAKIDVDLDELPADLKWRGIALDHYDGKSWSNTKAGYRRVRQRDGLGRILVSRRRRQNEFLVQQNILLEPFSKVIFGLPDMISISGNTLPARFVFQDGNDAISVFRRGRRLLRYYTYSDIVARGDRMALAAPGPIPDMIQVRYLQLPGLDPRMEQLAAEITADSESPLEKALAIEDFLTTEYGYSLSNQSALAADPLADFLFSARTGHCEYFATAQAVFMRRVGIPARVVNGFRLGEFNEFSGYFIVRQSDAHSWVEGYVPGAGWIEFDATPVTVPIRRSLTLAEWFGQLLGAIDIFWTEVVTFDRVKQVGLFRSMRNGVHSTWTRVSDISSRLDDLARSNWLDRIAARDLSGLIYLLALPIVLAALGMAYRYRRYLKIWKGRALGQKSSEIAPEYYLEMLDILGHKGLVKAGGETPYEFADRVEAAMATAAPLQITSLYYRNRFGHYPLAPADLSSIYRWLKELRH